MVELRKLAYKTSAAFAGPWVSVSAGIRPGLRILAYHTVGHSELFRAQISYLADNFEPITAEEVVRGRFTQRRRPVWVTIDDGDRSLVESAMPVLDEYGISATAFICTGLVDSMEPLWWDVIRKAVDENTKVDGDLVSQHEISRLKQVDDRDRRQRVKQIREAVEASAGQPLVREQLTTADLRNWVESGHSVGNHTWDHPLLDMCEPAEQRRQIGFAHEWLIDNFAPDELLFAYPNGNHASIAESVLQELGYNVGVLFDHRIQKGGRPLRMSRIRVNAKNDLAEFKSKVSGIHPLIHRALSRS